MDRVLKFLSGNFALKIISVGIATVLWFYVLGSQQTETTKDIPIEYVTDDNIVPAKDSVSKVQVRLSVPKAFMRVVLSRNEKPILINLRGKSPGWYTSRVFSDSIKVPFGVKVLEVQPREIRVQLEKLRTKTVPVVTEVVGKPPEGYRIGKIIPNPEQVSIKGHWTDIKDIKSVVVWPIDVAGFVESQSTSSRWETEGTRYTIQGEEPTVYVEVIAISPNYKIKNVPIKVIGATRYEISHTQVTVFIRALEADLKSLDQSKVIAEIDLTEKLPGRHKEKIVVKVPRRISLVKTVPEEVRVILY